MTARRTKKERTALDRLAKHLGATVENVNGPRMRVELETPRGNVMAVEGTTQRCFAFLVFYAKRGAGMETDEVARITGYVGPVTIVGLTGPDEHRLLTLARAGRRLKRGA